MEAKAHLRNARISPRKIRPVADLVRGRPLGYALANLAATQRKGASLLKKALESARSNAFEKQIDVDTLKVKSVSVDQGPIMYRIMPRQRGMAYRIRKRTSHLSVTLGD